MSQTLYRVTAQKVNVRAAASAKSALVGSLSRGDTVPVTNVENDWAAILFKQKTRYVSAKYIELVEKKVDPSSDVSEKAITTPVVNSIGTTAQTINELVQPNTLIVEKKAPTRDRGLQITFEGGYNNSLFGMDDAENESPERKTFMSYGGNIVLTYKLNPNFAFGIGAGVNKFETSDIKYHSDGYDATSYHHTDYDYTGFDECKKGFSYDVFARGVFRITDNNVSPLVSLDAGMRFNEFDLFNYWAYHMYDLDVDISKSSFFLSPAVGLSWRTSSNSYLELKAGYNYAPALKKQHFEETHKNGSHYQADFDKINMSSFFARLGFTFTLNACPKVHHERYQYNYSYFARDYQYTDKEQVKALFDDAYNTPDASAQEKYNKYMAVVKADAYGQNGFLAPAYNNIGVLYEVMGNLDKAYDYYRLAVKVSPDYTLAQDNWSRVISAQARERASRYPTQEASTSWLDIANGILNTISSFTGGGENGSNVSGTNSNSMDSFSPNSSAGSSSGKCSRCQGSGVCSPPRGSTNRKNACHGSKLCGWCDGTGWNNAGASRAVCTACGGSKKCKTCKGTGKCPQCGGTGK